MPNYSFCGKAEKVDMFETIYCIHTLLSDSDKEVRKLFGVKSNLLGILPGRETFVFNKEGNLTFKFKSMGADAHIEEALKHI